MSKPEYGPDEGEARPAHGEYPRAGKPSRSLRFSALAFVFALAACGQSGEAGQAAQAPAGDAEDGRLVFSRICGTCHDGTKDGPNNVGPNLFGVVGRASGTAPGYTYSDAMAMVNLTWDAAVLNEFLSGPQKKVPGTKMSFVGLTDRIDRADVVAYLSTLK